MKERFEVFVNERPVEVYQGMEVKHALMAYDYGAYKACTEGQAMVRDRNGFQVGLDGALAEGTQLFIIKGHS
jgi:hypothetical protein